MMTTTCERGNERAHFNFMSLGEDPNQQQQQKGK